MSTVMSGLPSYTPKTRIWKYKHAHTYSGRMLSHQMQPHPLPHPKMNEQKWNEDLSYVLPLTVKTYLSMYLKKA